MSLIETIKGLPPGTVRVSHETWHEMAAEMAASGLAPVADPAPRPGEVDFQDPEDGFKTMLFGHRVLVDAWVKHPAIVWVPLGPAYPRFALMAQRLLTNPALMPRNQQLEGIVAMGRIPRTAGDAALITFVARQTAYDSVRLALWEDWVSRAAQRGQTDPRDDESVRGACEPKHPLPARHK